MKLLFCRLLSRIFVHITQSETGSKLKILFAHFLSRQMFKYFGNKKIFLLKSLSTQNYRSIFIRAAAAGVYVNNSEKKMVGGQSIMRTAHTHTQMFVVQLDKNIPKAVVKLYFSLALCADISF